MSNCCNCGRFTGADALIVRTAENETYYMCQKCFNSTRRDMEPLIYKLQQAISLLKQCVNWDNDPMRTGIDGELKKKIREFIRRCE